MKTSCSILPLLSFCLCLTGCEREEKSVSAVQSARSARGDDVRSNPDGPNSGGVTLGQVEGGLLGGGSLSHGSFPKTPDKVDANDFEPLPDFKAMDDQVLVGMFETPRVDPALWSYSLKEMARRQTPDCLNAMARNLLTIGAPVRSSNMPNSPELGYPVVLALLDCKSVGFDVMKGVALNPAGDQKTRVIAVKGMMLLKDPDEMGDWFPGERSRTETAALAGVIAIATDDEKLKELFPFERPQALPVR